MTPEQIAELKELCQKATPGPWDIDEGDGTIYFFDEHSNAIPIYEENRKNNITICAAARTALPELIAALEELDKRLDKSLDDFLAQKKYAHELESRIERLQLNIAELREWIKGAMDAADEICPGILDNQEYDIEQRGRDTVICTVNHAVAHEQAVSRKLADRMSRCMCDLCEVCEESCLNDFLNCVSIEDYLKFAEAEVNKEAQDGKS